MRRRRNATQRRMPFVVVVVSSSSSSVRVLWNCACLDSFNPLVRAWSFDSKKTKFILLTRIWKKRQNKTRKEKKKEVCVYRVPFFCCLLLISSRSSVELISRVCLPVETETQDQSPKSEKKQIKLQWTALFLSVCLSACGWCERARVVVVVVVIFVLSLRTSDNTRIRIRIRIRTVRRRRRSFKSRENVQTLLRGCKWHLLLSGANPLLTRRFCVCHFHNTRDYATIFFFHCLLLRVSGVLYAAVRYTHVLLSNTREREGSG